MSETTSQTADTSQGDMPPGLALLVQSNKDGDSDTSPSDILSTPNLLQDRFSQGQLANYFPLASQVAPRYLTSNALTSDQSLTAPRSGFIAAPEVYPMGGPEMMYRSGGDPSWWPMTTQPTWGDKFWAGVESGRRNVFDDAMNKAAGLDVDSMYKADDLYNKLYGGEFPTQLGVGIGKALDPVQYLALMSLVASGGESELASAALGDEAGGFASALSKVTGISPETLSDVWKDFKWQALIHQFDWNEQNKPIEERIQDSISHAASGVPYGLIPHVGNEEEMRGVVKKVLDWYGTNYGKDIEGIIPKGLREVLEDKVGERAIAETDMLLRKFAEWAGHGAVYRGPSKVAETYTEPYAEPLVERGAEAGHGAGSLAYQAAYDYSRMPMHYYPGPIGPAFARPDPWGELRSPWRGNYRLVVGSGGQ